MKNKDEIFNGKINEVFDSITPEELEETRISFSIASRLHDILDERNMTQKDLAKLLGKRESEISRWLKGMHNFTMKSIAKLQVALEEKVLEVPGRKKEKSKALPEASVNESIALGPLKPLKIVHSAKRRKETPEAA